MEIITIVMKGMTCIMIIAFIMEIMRPIVDVVVIVMVS